MKFIKKLYIFLSSIYFAIILISTVVLFVVAGTFIESHTGSHRYASYFTYQNPVFIGILWGFFINILFSALRRWPFKWHHLPFLITHFGLLMILSGTIIKSYYGVQGSMGVIEGGGSQQIFVPNTYVLHIEKRNPHNPRATIAENYPLQKSWRGKFRSQLPITPPFEELNMVLLEYIPNSIERFETWIKGNRGFITGLKPFEVHDWTTKNLQQSAVLPVSTRVRLNADPAEPWEVYAGLTDDVATISQKVFLQCLHRSPALLFLKDPQQDTFLFAFDARGNIFNQAFPCNQISPLVVYDQGFGGYAIPAKIPSHMTQGEKITLECPLTPERVFAPSKQKLEENLPRIAVLAKKTSKKELVTLSYDRFGQGLKWPMFGGEYLIRFQPQFITLPYRIRLRQARQINYPNSKQPYSFESDLIITDLKRQTVTESTISMNHVYETWDGYRFYLANISPNSEGSLKRIQLVVNYDPAKYFLTYPGALILSLGVFLLFWLRPYQHK